MTVYHAAARYIVSTTAETLEINRQKLLLLIPFKQQVCFDMEQTGRAGKKSAWPTNKHPHPSTLMRCRQRITPRTFYLKISVTFNDITSDKLVLNLVPLSHC